MSDPAHASSTGNSGLARRLGLFDATLIVMGGIIGAGIFKNPALVAKELHTPALVLGAWAIGGGMALVGAFVYAELAALRPQSGGQYAYLRDAYHPMVAFLYGWTLLLVTQTGGMAAVAVNFASYLHQVSPQLLVSEKLIAVALIALLTVINCFGVRMGSNVQSGLMIAKLAAIVLLIGAGLFLIAPANPSPGQVSPESCGGWKGLMAAMVPVFFAYGGWQTASFISGEMKHPERDLPRGLLIGVVGVITVYLLVTFVCLKGLGVEGLAKSATPASDVMRLALGETGAKIISLGIIVSIAGFLSQGMLTAPRVYYSMARDGVFFKLVGWLHPKNQAPVAAIALQGICTAVIAAAVDYGNILNFVVAIDLLFFGLTGAALLVFRARQSRATGGPAAARHVRVPGHPFTTTAFVLACWSLAVVTVVQFHNSAGAGVVILAAGAVVYQFWRVRRAPVVDGSVEGR
jgi:APA family basic amino acid/polyamine antiporter